MPNILDLSALDMVANNALRDIAFDNFNLYLNEETLTNDQIKIKQRILKVICMEISSFKICTQARH